MGSDTVRLADGVTVSLGDSQNNVGIGRDTRLLFCTHTAG